MVGALRVLGKRARARPGAYSPHAKAATNAILVDGLGAALHLRSTTAEEPLFSFQTQVKLVSLLDRVSYKIGC